MDKKELRAHIRAQKRAMTEAEIIVLMGRIFELPQVQTMLLKREVKPDGPVSL